MMWKWVGNEGFTITSISTFSTVWRCTGSGTEIMSSVLCLFNHRHRADGHCWRFWNLDISVKVLQLETWENAGWVTMWLSERRSTLRS